MSYLKETIKEMKIHEKEHRDFFEKEIKKRNIAPTKFLPLNKHTAKNIVPTSTWKP